MEEMRLVTFEDTYEERRRKRKQSYKHIDSEVQYKLKKISVEQSGMKHDLRLHTGSPHVIVIKSNHEWQCGSTETNECVSLFDEKVCINGEEIYGSWALDANGDMCLVNDSPDETIETDLSISPSNSCSRSPSGSITAQNTSCQSNRIDEKDQSNLSWLLNFRVDSLFKTGDIQHDHNYLINKRKTVCLKGPKNQVSIQGQQLSSNEEDIPQVGLCSSDSKSNSRKYHDKPLAVNENGSRKATRKPPFTYSELIERSLKENNELTVSGIYNWISEHYPYYEANDERWKNSVRHNLSINPYFRKGRKSPKGAGHLWGIAASCKEADITYEQDVCYESDIEGISLNEVAAATASIEEDKENRQLPPDMYFFEDAYNGGNLEGELGGQSLMQTAEEVLKGVKKNVEVQYVIQSQKKFPDKESEFLNPISVKEVVEESGLSYQLADDGGMYDDKNASFFITEINPETLGINMVGSDLIATDLLFSDHVDNDLNM